MAYLPKLNENGAAAPSFFSSVEDANGLLEKNFCLIMKFKQLQQQIQMYLPRPNENVLAGVSVADVVKVDLLE